MPNLYKIDEDFQVKKVKKIEKVGQKGKKTKKIKSKINFALVNSLNIGYYILTPLLVGVFLGLALDKLFKLKGVFVLIFIILGTIASFYNLYKLYKNG